MDKREAILARVVQVCAALPGIVSAQRNVIDVPLLQRPAVVVQDGGEERLDAPASATHRSDAMRMELTPQLWLFVRGSAADAGALLSLFRGRILQAVAHDQTLLDLTGTVGGIRYEGCMVVEPAPETKETRMDVNFTFVYTLRLGDLEE